MPTTDTTHTAQPTAGRPSLRQQTTIAIVYLVLAAGLTAVAPRLAGISSGVVTTFMVVGLLLSIAWTFGLVRTGRLHGFGDWSGNIDGTFAGLLSGLAIGACLSFFGTLAFAEQFPAHQTEAVLIIGAVASGSFLSLPLNFYLVRPRA